MAIFIARLLSDFLELHFMRWRSFYGYPTIVRRVSSLFKFLFYYKFYREKNKKYKPLILLTVTIKSPVEGLRYLLELNENFNIFYVNYFRPCYPSPALSDFSPRHYIQWFILQCSGGISSLALLRGQLNIKFSVSVLE